MKYSKSGCTLKMVAKRALLKELKVTDIKKELECDADPSKKNIDIRGDQFNNR